MPSTGVPRSNNSGAHLGAPASDTLFGPPERMIPTGFFALRVSSDVLNGTISEYTDSSRSRRAMSCVYCEPKSRTRMVWWDTNGGIIPQGIVSRRISATIFATFLLAEVAAGGVCLGAAPKKKILPVPLPLLPVAQEWIATLDDVPSAGGAMDDERVYIPIEPEMIVALGRSTGAKLWTRDVGSMWPPVVIDETLYVAASDEIHALDAATGQERWRTPFEGAMTAPLVAAGMRGSDLLLATVENGRVIAFAADDGRTLWTRDLGASSRFAPALDGTRAFFALDDSRAVAVRVADGRVEWEQRLE